TSRLLLAPRSCTRCPLRSSYDFPCWPKPAEQRPGRPEEFHHQPPTDPYVNLSIHTARASPPLATSRLQAYAVELTPPAVTVCSVHRRTGLSPSLHIHYRCFAPTTGQSAPAGASLLSPFVVRTYRVFACHHQPGSHVVRKSPSQARAN